jgi:ribonucleoside-diphosphate reductase alpha chain
MIALFSHDDEDMLTCKFGNWWELNEQRGRANNSAVLERGQISEEEFRALWKKIELSNSGEPGFYWTKNIEWGTNPCCEIALRPYQFCNLCEVNVSDVVDEEDLMQRVKVAAFFGTLQASYTDFHYLRSIWQKTTEKDALLGIGMTGIGSGEILKYDLKKAADVAKEANAFYAEEIGINKAARVTCIKPSGTTSCVLGTASGIHAWHNDYYLRTVRFNKSEDIAKYLMANHPEICEDDALRSHDTLCVRIPIKAPAGSLLRTETPIELLERVKHFSTNWIKSGHRNGYNSHNVSATVSIKQDEWETVGDWMWENRNHYNGLSVLPYWGGTYVQAPFEDITKEQYEEKIKHLTSIDLTNVIEEDDTVNFGAIAACAGGACAVE